MSSYGSYSDYSDNDYSPGYSDNYEDNGVSDRSLTPDEQGPSLNDVTHSSATSEDEDARVSSPVNLPTDTIDGAQALTPSLEEQGSFTNDVIHSSAESGEEYSRVSSPINPTNDSNVNGEEEEVVSEEGSYYSGSKVSYVDETESGEDEREEEESLPEQIKYTPLTSGSASLDMGNRIQHCECLNNLGKVKEKLFRNRVYENFCTLHLSTPKFCLLVLSTDEKVSNNSYGLPNTFWTEFLEENKKRQRKQRRRPLKEKPPIEHLSLDDKTPSSTSALKKDENWSKWLKEVKSVMTPVSNDIETKP